MKKPLTKTEGSQQAQSRATAPAPRDNDVPRDSGAVQDSTGAPQAAPSIVRLFLTFFRIGLFTFGGGYAMLSIIDDTCVDKNGWITPEEMLDMTVVAESTPGPIAINCATYVGRRQRGLAGALAATFGVVLPSFVIILAISFFLERFLEIGWVASAFRGIKLAVGILIADAGIKLIKKAGRSALTVTVLVVATAVMLVSEIFSMHIPSIVMLLAAAAVGIAVFLIRGPRKGGAA